MSSWIVPGCSLHPFSNSPGFDLGVCFRTNAPLMSIQCTIRRGLYLIYNYLYLYVIFWFA